MLKNLLCQASAKPSIIFQHFTRCPGATGMPCLQRQAMISSETMHSLPVYLAFVLGTQIVQNELHSLISDTSRPNVQHLLL